MNYTPYRYLLFCIGMLLTISNLCFARFEIVDGEDEFHQILQMNTYVAVHFNPYDDDGHDERKAAMTKRAFFDVAQKARYARAGIVFIEVHVPEITLHEPDMQAELEDLGIDHEASTIMLFKHGKPVVTEDNLIVSKVGNRLFPAEIAQFIEQRWGRQITRLVDALTRQEPAGVQMKTMRSRGVAPERVQQPIQQPMYGGYAIFPYDTWGYYAPYNYWSWNPGYGWRGSWGGRGFRSGHVWENNRPGRRCNGNTCR